MAHVNTSQEKKRIAKTKVTMYKHIKVQNELEKGMIWEPIPYAPGNAKRLVKNKKT